MQPQPQLLSRDQFGQAIKAQYPAYKDIPNLDLANKILAKYPVYQRQISDSSVNVAEKQSQQANSPLGLATETAKGVGSALISSEKGLGNEIAAGIGAKGAAQNTVQAATQQQQNLSAAAKKIQELKTMGIDTSSAEQHLKDINNGGTQGTNVKDVLPASEDTPLDVALNAGGVAADIASGGTYGAGAKAAELSKMSAPELTTYLKGSVQGLQHGLASDIAQQALSQTKQPIEQFVKDAISQIPKGFLQTGLNSGEKVAEGMKSFQLSNAAPSAATAAKDVGQEVLPPIKQAAETVGQKIGDVASKFDVRMGGAAAEKAVTKNANKVLDYITPTSKDIPETQFKDLLHQGQIQPRSGLNPAKYILSDSQKETALKYADTISKDPVTTSINIGNKIGSIDKDVGNFLEKNNAIFNTGELKNHLQNALADVQDIMVPKENLAEGKTNIVSNFIDSLEKNDMKTLWQSRKAFDQKIERAFSGAPTLQKQIKTTLRNAVQDFIADRTPEGKYKAYMKDMTNLFNVRDLADIKASKGRGLDQIADWAKKNPRTAKVLGIIGLGALGSTIYGATSEVVHAGQ